MSTIDSHRKQIILSEIDFWKQNNMLPEHYCDYLFTLYTEGEEVQSVSFPKKVKRVAFQ